MPISKLAKNPVLQPRVQQLFDEHRQRIFKHTDRLFVGLMIFQWAAGILLALIVSPKTWIGAASETHVHVWAAIFLGGAIAAAPIALGLLLPGRTITRHVVAVSQMLFSSLLIHLTGGRIETHFHVFGSLAFLAFYRDWKVLIPATIVVAVDHMLRGIFWPQSVFGVLTASSWRWVEHSAWVLFENVFLYASCKRSVKEMWHVAERTAQLEDELHRSEETLGQVQNLTAQLEQSNRSLEQFAYTAAHDLKAPLRILKLYSEILRKKFKNAEAGELINTIISHADNLENLTTSLLEYAKVQGKKEFHKFDCEAALQRALGSLELDIKESGAEVTSDQLGSIYGDQNLLSQLFQNLISNAIKFRSEAAPRIEISRFYDEDMSVFAIKDNGLGMREEDEQEIFEIFRRGNADVEGSGIGLATCKKIVEIHGGRIWVKSQAGKGSIFYFSLPESPVAYE